MLTKSLVATAVAIAGYKILAATTNDQVQVAAANTDPLVGTSGQFGAPASGMVDVKLVGWDEVVLGGTVLNGDPLTSDASGNAIKALPSASTQVRIIGFALQAGVANDVIQYRIAVGTLSKASA